VVINIIHKKWLGSEDDIYMTPQKQRTQV
jgi:hypothetical protein